MGASVGSSKVERGPSALAEPALNGHIALQGPSIRCNFHEAHDQALEGGLATNDVRRDLETASPVDGRPIIDMWLSPTRESDRRSSRETRALTSNVFRSKPGDA